MKKSFITSEPGHVRDGVIISLESSKNKFIKMSHHVTNQQSAYADQLAACVSVHRQYIPSSS